MADAQGSVRSNVQLPGAVGAPRAVSNIATGLSTSHVKAQISPSLGSCFAVSVFLLAPGPRHAVWTLGARTIGRYRRPEQTA